MTLIPPWLRPPRVRERLASYHLRSDVLDAAAAMPLISAPISMWSGWRPLSLTQISLTWPGSNPTSDFDRGLRDSAVLDLP
jgi:hypothetical protein